MNQCTWIIVDQIDNSLKLTIFGTPVFPLEINGIKEITFLGKFEVEWLANYTNITPIHGKKFIYYEVNEDKAYISDTELCGYSD